MPNRRLDISGQRFGKLVAIERSERKTTKGQYYWICKCDCGNYTEAVPSNLKHGHVTSCGCVSRQSHSDVMKRWHDEHPENRQTHGLSSTRLFVVWADMRARCGNENSTNYRNYGGRGIKVCDEWADDFAAFYEWACKNGYDETAPRGVCTLDRINTNGNYEPSNCRFVDAKQQANNRRENRYLEIGGEKKTVSEWAERCDMPYATLYHRVFYKGIAPEVAIDKSKFRQRKQEVTQ